MRFFKSNYRIHKQIGSRMIKSVTGRNFKRIKKQHDMKFTTSRDIRINIILSFFVYCFILRAQVNLCHLAGSNIIIAHNIFTFILSNNTIFQRKQQSSRSWMYGRINSYPSYKIGAFLILIGYEHILSTE